MATLDQGRPADRPSTIARIEALLFVATGQVDISHLAQTLEATVAEIEAALTQLASQLAGRGIRLQRQGSAVQLTSGAEFAADVERFLQIERAARLSRAALEVLAIVAYQQPVTRPRIDAIRGVNSEHALRTLLGHGLIEELGRSEAIGRPILYVTTAEFLQYFGLTSLSDLPALQPEPIGSSGAPASAPGTEAAAHWAAG